MVCLETMVGTTLALRHAPRDQPMGSDGPAGATMQMDRNRLRQEAMALSVLLLSIADREMEADEGAECLVLDGILRDCGYLIRRAAERLQEQVGPC